MESTVSKLASIETTPARARPDAMHWFALAASRLKILSHSAIWGSPFWKSLGTRRQRKTLRVRETAPLGDRRFVSVIQFERQRFLIGSSPAAVTLLAQLPDESANGPASGEKN